MSVNDVPDIFQEQFTVEVKGPDRSGDSAAALYFYIAAFATVWEELPVASATNIILMLISKIKMIFLCEHNFMLYF